MWSPTHCRAASPTLLHALDFAPVAQFMRVQPAPRANRLTGWRRHTRAAGCAAAGGGSKRCVLAHPWREMKEGQKCTGGKTVFSTSRCYSTAALPSLLCSRGSTHHAAARAAHAERSQRACVARAPNTRRRCDPRICSARHAPRRRGETCGPAPCTRLHAASAGAARRPPQLCLLVAHAAAR